MIRSTHRRRDIARPLAAAIALAAAAAAQSAPHWLRAPAFDLRFGAAMAFDAVRGRVILFGGSSVSSNAVDDQWEWNGSELSLLRSTAHPPPRRYHAMACDRDRGCVVLFGGQRDGATPASLADTWEWNGADWLQRAPLTTPPARQDHVMVYDEARRRVVMFAGRPYHGDAWLQDTWEYDGLDWRQRTPANWPTNWPTARAQHAAAYDAARRRTVIFGGQLASAAPLGDTWEWDGNSWQQQTPPLSPPASYGHGMVYDRAAQRVLLVGGRGGDGDVWSWDGATWQSTHPTSVTYSYDTAIAYDEVRQRAVMQDGIGIAEWDGGNWQRTRADTPDGRVLYGLAYDGPRQRAVLFGGGYAMSLGPYPGNVYLNDTWEWDGGRWQQRTTAVAPPARRGHALAFDAARGETLLFGGQDDTFLFTDTWTWNGTAWTQRAPAVSPPLQAQPLMAYDVSRQRVVMVGGGGTWEWDGGNWALRVLNGPGGWPSTALAYDQVRQRTVLSGGYPGPVDTWEWDGAVWTRRTPVHSPPPRQYVAMDYDPRRQRVVALGGTTGGTLDAWEWDGVDWSAQPTPAAPLAGRPLAVVYETAAARFLVSIDGYATWYWGGLQPGWATIAGAGCANGAAAAPRLIASSPMLGNANFAVDVLDAPALAPCLYGISPAAQNLPLGCGCALYLQNPIVLLPATANAQGIVHLALPLPLLPALRGATGYLQAAVLAPPGPCGPIALSNALRLQLGD